MARDTGLFILGPLVWHDNVSQKCVFVWSFILNVMKVRKIYLSSTLHHEAVARHCGSTSQISKGVNTLQQHGKKSAVSKKVSPTKFDCEKHTSASGFHHRVREKIYHVERNVGLIVI